MKRLSFVVLSALVLGLGLRVFARTRLRAQPRALHATAHSRATSAAAASSAIAVAHAATSITESQTALVKQVLRDLSQRSQQEQRGRIDARQLRCGEGRPRRAGRRSRGEDDPQAALGHDAAAERAASRRGGARRRLPRRWSRGSIRPRRSIRIPAVVRSSASIAPNTRARCSALLALDVDVNAFLPPDTISAGFDNVADAQTFSATLMEGYLRAASRISALAVGDPKASAVGIHLQGAAHRLADASRRGRAVRHARRRLGDAHLPGRRRIQLPHAAALDPDRPVVRQHGQGRAASKCRSTASASRCSRSTRA